MKKPALLFLILVSAFVSLSAQEVLSPHETARTFMRSGDFDNAILVLNKALDQEPKNSDIRKDLVLSYYYKRNYSKAKEELEPLLDNDAADVVTYQLAGNIYKALEEVKAADKMYKKALKKFPASGALYSEYGELLWAAKNNDAINYWEKGIKADPSFAGNYYNAALYHFYTKDKVWTLVYGEIFINMESLTERAAAMKQLLFTAYKEKLFNDLNEKSDDKNKSEFTRAFLQNMNKQSALVTRGINTETLTMIRSRFILDWFASYATKFPFKLFDYQRQLMQEGMFEAYNQWLFGTIENLAAYDNWTKTHTEAYSSFTTFQKGRIFKMPPGQYYQ
ncbi:MAG TPA: tetratricopeptide repeat protein [Chitinophagaceae bacterium]|jgi:tetratricopeptide (TPR) repeat protein|nr:tetratricopeptide repeat protein [Chitinophagaceae bacterium]